jgi:hypothetical protein
MSGRARRSAVSSARRCTRARARAESVPSHHVRRRSTASPQSPASVSTLTYWNTIHSTARLACCTSGVHAGGAPCSATIRSSSGSMRLRPTCVSPAHAAHSKRRTRALAHARTAAQHDNAERVDGTGRHNRVARRVVARDKVGNLVEHRGRQRQERVRGRLGEARGVRQHAHLARGGARSQARALAQRLRSVVGNARGVPLRHAARRTLAGPLVGGRLAARQPHCAVDHHVETQAAVARAERLLKRRIQHDWHRLVRRVLAQRGERLAPLAALLVEHRVRRGQVEERLGEVCGGRREICTTLADVTRQRRELLIHDGGVGRLAELARHLAVESVRAPPST